MKKLLGAILALFVLGTAQASHLVGGQITATALNNQRLYSLELTLYRDNTGIQMYNTETLVVVGNGLTINVPIVKPNPTLIWGTATNGIEEYVFQTNFTFPMAGTYKIYYQNCCRNAGIRNTTSTPGSYLETTILVDSSLNSSPTFLNRPFALALQNVQWFHNPIPFDVDGDSLAWSLDTPKEYFAGVVSSVPSYFHPDSDPGFPFAMDSYTGVISWQPTLRSRYIASVLVKEFRGGVQIGATRRDYQFLVDSNQTGIPNVTSGQFGPRVGSAYVVRVSPGARYNLVFETIDPNEDSVDVRIVGEPFRMVNNMPSITHVRASRGRTQTTMNWQTTLGMARTRPYLTAITVTEYRNNAPYYNQDFTVLYTLQNATSTQETSGLNAEIYPNPSAGQPIMVNLYDLQAGNITMEIFDLQGKKVWSKNVEQNYSGTMSYMIQSPFQPGTYVLKMQQSGKSLVKKIVIQ
jgi:hypothetical protein